MIPRDDAGRPSEGGRSRSRSSILRPQGPLIINLYPRRLHLPIFLSHHLRPRPHSRNKPVRKTKAGAVKKGSFDLLVTSPWNLKFIDTYTYNHNY
jgi:hypothetical protein